jgi:hypothetical protein
MARWWPALLVLVPGAACVRGAAFHCVDHGECGAGATCEPTGFCSFPDESCPPPMRRYGDYAGARAGECVTEEGAPDGGGGDAGPPADAFAGEGLVLVDDTPPDPMFGSLSSAMALFRPGPTGFYLGDPVAGAAGCDLYARWDSVPGELGVGPITVSGGNAPFMILPAGSPPAITYHGEGIPADPFPSMGGDIQLVAGGGGFPGFVAEIDVPAAVADATFPASVTRGMPVTLSWTPAPADAAWAFIASTTGTISNRHMLICPLPGLETGGFAIPGAATELLPPGNTYAVVGLRRIARVTVPAGTGSVTLMASQSAISAVLDVTP